MNPIPPWDQLTPLQQIVSDLLVARYRLGEVRWSIKKSPVMSKALKNMRDVGWITYEPHNASPNYLYVSLTSQGKEMSGLPDYPEPMVKTTAMIDLPSGIFENARVKEVRIIYT